MIRGFLLGLVLVVLGGCAEPLPVGTLAEGMAATAPGGWRLNPAWVGTARDTVATGFFAKEGENAKQRERRLHLRFDRFHYSDVPSAWGFGARMVSRSAGGESETDIHSYRESLPSDEEIMRATTPAQLGALLGRSQGFSDGWGSLSAMHTTGSWSFFTMRGPETMETVSVFCMMTLRCGPGESTVDSVQVTRGTARPEGR
jgi:hypothetical protein